MLRSLLTSFAIIIIGTSCVSSNYLQVYDLSCENLTNPIGIDNTKPHFSWKLSSKRNGTEQKAYTILVATDSLLLKQGIADLWNSGKVKSSASIFVPYKGKELQARGHAYWKVGVWDEKSRQPVWSDIASFSIGLLSPNDWTGAYIGLPREAGNPESPLLRKTFEINNPDEKAYLHINSLGYHELYINGSKIGEDVLTPAVSQFNKRSLAVTYDVSPYLRQGRNELVVWLGRGWYQPQKPGVIYEGPLVKAQLEVKTENNWKIVFASDSTWTCRESGYTGIGAWHAWSFGGEEVEAGKLLEDFTVSTLDAVDWIAVQEVDVPTHTVSPMMTEANRIQEKIHPLRITPSEKDAWLVDMGKVLTGQVEIHFPLLKEGQEVVMEYFDHFLEDGRPINQGQIDRYIASGKNKEIFRNKFNHHGFQYIKISNLSAPLSPEDICAYLIHTNFKEASSFQCSDPEMNAIHDMVQYALRCLTLGGYMVDCPQIERLGYGGDGNASTQTAQTMFNLSPLYANWIQAWADCIREDGGMPHTAPNPYPAGGGPYWCGFIITASWNTYVNYGDSRLIEKYYPVMQRWLEYVQKHTVNGLLQRWPDTDYRDWFLGDWATPIGVDMTAKLSVDLVNNCFISVCYATMEKIAAFLDKTNDALIYAEKKEEIRQLLHDRFFDNSRNSYATGSQIDLIYPMLAQVTPESLIPAVIETLYKETAENKGGHLALGLVGIPVLTEWAILNRSVDWVYGMLKKKDYPGYLYMLENGATATWEHWNGDRSRIHNCYNGIGAWFYQAIGGIRPDENFPGYRRVIISPQIPEGITWAKTAKETPFGKLIVDWKLQNEILHIDLTIPPGCRALLELPENVREYKIDGKPYFCNKKRLHEINSGKYQMVCRLSTLSERPVSGG